MSKLFRLFNYVPKREFSVTQCLEGKRNFRKFPLFNKRGSRLFKEKQFKNPDPDIPIKKRGVRDTGYVLDGRYVEVPEMIPELIVPDLKDCQFKPYVSYKAPDVIQSEFTPEELFNAVYGEKIIKDFKTGGLDESGLPLNPSPYENLSPKEAYLKARQTGSDIFNQQLPTKE